MVEGRIGHVVTGDSANQNGEAFRLDVLPIRERIDSKVLQDNYAFIAIFLVFGKSQDAYQRFH